MADAILRRAEARRQAAAKRNRLLGWAAVLAITLGAISALVKITR